VADYHFHIDFDGIAALLRQLESAGIPAPAAAATLPIARFVRVGGKLTAAAAGAAPAFSVSITKGGETRAFSEHRPVGG
jgi:hypothetical protein